MQKLTATITQVDVDYNQAEMNTAKLLLDLKCKLGEGCLWRDNSLYFTDIENCKWHKLDFTHKSLTTVDLPNKCGSFAFCQSNKDKFLMSMQTGFCWMHPDYSLEPIESDYALAEDGRLNDGRCDRQSRFVVGGMKFAEPKQMPVF